MPSYRLRIGVICTSFFCWVQHAHAVTDNMPFSATVLSTCTIVIATPGVMAPNAGFTVLDTEEAGGNAGTATLTTTAGTFSMSVDAPTVFSTVPTGGNDNLTFAAKYSSTGATTSSDVVGTVTTTLNPGTTTMEVDLKATKSSGVFPVGAYATTATVRCE